MQLTEFPDIVLWPAIHYVFIERVGPFAENAPKAWMEFHRLRAGIAAQNRITGALSLYKVGPRIYRAGVSVAAAPTGLAPELRYELFLGGRYCRFVLTGLYSKLGPATGRATQIVAEQKIALREDFHIEHYRNDPATTPEAELETEILFPVK